MRIDRYDTTWQVNDVEELEGILSSRDSRGGGEFWLADSRESYPCLVIRVSGDIADVHFFSTVDHPGFRCLGNQDAVDDGFTTLVYEGCDPASGEQTPNVFVIPVDTAKSIAREFFRSKWMSNAVSWFEL